MHMSYVTCAVYALVLQHHAGSTTCSTCVNLYRHLWYIQAYLPKGQGGRLLARMQAIRYAGVCVSSFLVTFLGNDKRQELLL